MGAILETADCKLGRTIAAKVMLLEQDASEDMRQRFIQEAAVLAKLVKDRTLQNILDDLRLENPVALREYTLDRLLTVFRKVADALAFAHSKGIIHRDLKPENIMVGEFGEVLLMDWGLAKIQEAEVGRAVPSPPREAGEPAHDSTGERSPGTGDDGAVGTQRPTLTQRSSLTNTMQGAVMGTPKYMSPEQAMGLVDGLDARSDVFSLGGILYAILTLRPPVEGKTVQEVLAKVSSASGSGSPGWVNPSPDFTAGQRRRRRDNMPKAPTSSKAREGSGTGVPFRANM